MWTQEATDHYARARKHYEKKHWRELAAVERNLNTYFVSLSAGAKPSQIKFGFVHTKYKLGVASITEQGGGRGLAPARLYIYPDVPNGVLWLLTIGDKNTQPADVQLCYALVADISPVEDKDDDQEQGDSPADGGG